MQNITVYSKGYCPYCKAAKSLLSKKGLSYTEVDVQKNADNLKEMLTRSNRRTVPQIFFGDKHIGGFDDLVDHFSLLTTQAQPINL